MEDNIFHIDDIECEIAPLTWGEKNRIIDASTKYHKVTESYYIDNILFDEKMLQTCIKKMVKNDIQITLSDLECSLGEKLYNFCLNINSKAKNDEKIPQKYEMFSQENQYKIIASNIELIIRKWSFGEKVDAIKSCSVFDPQTGNKYIKNRQLEEICVVTCCQYLKLNGNAVEVNLETIQNLPVVWGEFLAKIVMTLNNTTTEYKKELVQAVRNSEAHEAITMYRLAKEFGWTPKVIRSQRAEDIENLITIILEREKIQQIIHKHGADSTTILFDE